MRRECTPLLKCCYRRRGYTPRSLKLSVAATAGGGASNPSLTKVLQPRRGGGRPPQLCINCCRGPGYPPEAMFQASWNTLQPGGGGKGLEFIKYTNLYKCVPIHMENSGLILGIAGSNRTSEPPAAVRPCICFDFKQSMRVGTSNKSTCSGQGGVYIPLEAEKLLQLLLRRLAELPPQKVVLLPRRGGTSGDVRLAGIFVHPWVGPLVISMPSAEEQWHGYHQRSYF